jgi:hypothetical protein
MATTTLYSTSDKSSTAPLLGDRANDPALSSAGASREDEKTLLSVFCPVLGILALGAVGIIAISGQFPWFLLPLGVFLFFASCLPWRRFP